jgi:hypothetical protein
MHSNLVIPAQAGIPVGERHLHSSPHEAPASAGATAGVVIPAKAGIPVGERHLHSSPHEVPGFAGMTGV